MFLQRKPTQQLTENCQNNLNQLKIAQCSCIKTIHTPLGNFVLPREKWIPPTHHLSHTMANIKIKYDTNMTTCFEVLKQTRGSLKESFCKQRGTTTNKFN